MFQGQLIKGLLVTDSIIKSLSNQNVILEYLSGRLFKRRFNDAIGVSEFFESAQQPYRFFAALPIVGSQFCTMDRESTPNFLRVGNAEANFIIITKKICELQFGCHSTIEILERFLNKPSLYRNTQLVVALLDDSGFCQEADSHEKFENQFLAQIRAHNNTELTDFVNSQIKLVTLRFDDYGQSRKRALTSIFNTPTLKNAYQKKLLEMSLLACSLLTVTFKAMAYWHEADYFALFGLLTMLSAVTLLIHQMESIQAWFVDKTQAVCGFALKNRPRNPFADLPAYVATLQQRLDRTLDQSAAIATNLTALTHLLGQSVYQFNQGSPQIMRALESLIQQAEVQAQHNGAASERALNELGGFVRDCAALTPRLDEFVGEAMRGVETAATAFARGVEAGRFQPVAHVNAHANVRVRMNSISLPIPF